MKKIKLETKRINNRLPEYTQAKQLYKRAFPESEQFPIWILRLLMIGRNANFFAYYDQEFFCGITYTIEFENSAYILYLAVNDEVRSKGYGSAILEYLKTIFGEKPIYLNVEPLEKNAENYAQRVERIAFYKKNGFKKANYTISDKSNTYTVLSTANPFSLEDYKSVLKKSFYGFYTPKIECCSE